MSGADTVLKQVRPETGIVHLRVPPESGARLGDFLLGYDLSPLPVVVTAELIKEWLHYGSVYADGKRVREDIELRAGQILRLHTRRKTYVTQIPKLGERIVFDHPDFLVLDKPSGLPTHATLDNCIENAGYLLAAEIGQPVYVTHRLDVATRGLLILAKTPKAQAAINKQFAKRQVVKIYRARVPTAAPLGLLVHYMDPASRVPKVMSAEPVAGWWECRMEILSRERIEHESPDRSAYLLEINLLTGKTHQILAQLSAIGAPINGDAAYGSGVPAHQGQIDLECYRMKMRWMQRDLEFSLTMGTF